MKKYLVSITLILATISIQAQVSQWAAFNDHFSGPQSGANVTLYNIFANGAPASGLLKNAANGTALGVTLSVTSVVTGVTGGTTSSGPNTGSPASLIFTNQVDFGNANSNHAIQLAGSAKIVHAFSGLDPSRRYTWHGTAARGGGYSDRWALLEISAASWQELHSTTATGLFTLVSSPNIPSLTASQAVANFGENRLLGTYACWTNIQPNPDGTILIYQSTYHGTMPGTFSSAGTYGYGVVADRLEEFTIGPSTCVGITNQSGNITVGERGLAQFSISPTGTPQTVQWYRSPNPAGAWTAIGGATAPTYSIPSAAYPGDNGARFYASVSNSSCNVTSTVKTLTVNQDLTAPTVASAFSGPAPNSVTVNFSEPMAPALIDAPNFVVFPTGTDPDGSPLVVTLATLNNGTNIVLTTDAALTVGLNYSVQMLDLRDDSSNQNPTDPNPAVADLAVRIQPIDFGAAGFNNIWKYSTETNLYGTGWETVGYNDSDITWQSGGAPLGFDASAGTGVQPAIVTPTPYLAHSEPTFFRRHFTMPPFVESQTTFTMRHVFEDGAVVFINGQEAGRYNVAAGTVLVDPADGTKGPRAAGAQTDPTPVSGPVTLPLTNVVIGDNVIAVVVVQSGDTSSDIEMAIELDVAMPSYPSGPASITLNPITSTNVNEGQPFTLTAGATGLVPLHVRWRKGGVDLPGQNGLSYVVSAAVPTDAGAYTFVASNSSGSATSTVATVTVNADLTSPAFLSAVANANLTNITLTFGERLNQGTAEDPSNYSVHLTAGGGSLTIISATLTNNGTNVVLVTSPRTQGQNYTVDLINIIDTSVNENPAVPSSRAIVAQIILAGFDQVWRYDETGADLGTTWKDVGFNDSAWSSGPGVLGVETTLATLQFLTNISPPNATNTVLSLTNLTGGGIGGTNVTIYFRTTVNLSFNPATATVTMRGYIDDGAALYVNGVERLRYNLAAGANYTNFATANLAEGVLTVSNLTGFVQGNNVIAVEVHQDSLGSSDIVWGMQLEALVPSFAAAGPTLHVTRNAITGAVTVSWSGSGTLQSTLNLQTAGTIWTPVPGNPNPYTFTPLAGQPAKFFSLAP